MTTGMLEWGQAGNYNAVNDRLVIRALTGAVFGLVLPPTMAAGSGLAVSLGPWLAIVDCGDGTSAVIGTTANSSINETAGGASQRTDALWADINVDGTAQWSLSWLASPVTGRTGVQLGTAVVPASAATAAAMTFTPGGAVRASSDQVDVAQWPNNNITTLTPLSKAYTIPANDLKVGTIYELEVPWVNTMQGQQLNLGLSLDGGALAPVTTIGGAIVAGGIGLNGVIRVWLQCLTTGAGGTMNVFLSGEVQQNGAAVLFNSGAAGFDGGNRALATAINTTVAHTIAVGSTWGAAAAGQVVTAYGSRCRRSGP